MGLRPASHLPVWTAPALVGSLAGVLGLVELGRRAFWIDEAFNVILVRDTWSSVLRTIADREPSQAVYLIGFKPWTRLVGYGEFVDRLPSVVAAAAAAALLVVLGRELFGTTVGVFAGLLLATNAGVVEWSQYARTYTLAVLATVVTTLLFVRSVRLQTTRAWLVYGIAGAVSVYCHFYAGFVLVAHAVSLLSVRPKGRLEGLARSWAVIAAGLVPFLIYVVHGTRSPVEWIPPLSISEIWRSIEFGTGMNIALLAVAVAGATVLGGSRRGQNRWKVALVVGWVVVPVVCGALVSLVKPALVPRFLIVTAPGFALLAAVALTQIRARTLRVIVLLAILGVAVVRIAHVYRQDPEDWRAAGRSARAASANGSAVAVLPAYGWRALAIYAPAVPIVREPTGRMTTVMVTGGAATRAALVRRFIAGTGYHVATVRRIGQNFAAERLIRDR